MRFQHSKIILLSSAIALLSSCAQTPRTASLPSISAPVTTNKTALRIYQVLPIYANAAKMKWEPIQMHVPLKKGATDAHIPEIRERLIALQEMPKSKDTKDTKHTTYDAQLAYAISEFQSLNGLKSTGVIDQATLNALNITPAQRYRELAKSMNEWAQYPEDENSRYIQVNIPEYQLRLVDHGQDVLRMKVIVGRPSRPTPTLSSKITTIAFNPHWTVPKTILAKDVIPGMRKNPNYMKEHYDMRLYASDAKNAEQIDASKIDWQTVSPKNFRYRVTAPPSDVNPLGRFKFIFANEHDVYMHDTPEKSLFALNDRARSSGCVRLENPAELVQYFYVGNNDLNAELVQQYLSTHQTKYVELRKPMPVYLTYILNWVDRDGRVHFGEDIYQKNT